MKVILLSDIRQRGKRGEVVEVKAGYARNFLLPQGIALVATPGNMKFFEQQRKKIDAKHTKERDAALAVAAQLAGFKITIAKRVGETQAMYGSVTASDVAAALKEKGVEVDKRWRLPAAVREPAQHTCLAISQILLWYAEDPLHPGNDLGPGSSRRGAAHLSAKQA